jgi:hypothetical protein
MSKQHMSKQELPKPLLQGNVGGTTLMEDHYYVQRLTEQIFLVRERMSADGMPGPDDRIVRSFSIRHDAYLYLNSLNGKQNDDDKEMQRTPEEGV